MYLKLILVRCHVIYVSLNYMILYEVVNCKNSCDMPVNTISTDSLFNTVFPHTCMSWYNNFIKTLRWLTTP